jgi:hypothetical protein
MKTIFPIAVMATATTSKTLVLFEIEMLLIRNEGSREWVTANL